MGQIDLVRFASDDDLAQTAAQAWLELLATVKTPKFSAALSGGRIARNFFSSLAKAPAAREKLDRVHFFWGDERCVPPNDPESNFGMAHELLFSPLKIDPAHLHRIKGEIDPEQAAREAATDLKRFAAADQQALPVIDVIFLGLGEDGHTASLFPSEPEQVRDDPAIFRHVVGSKPPPNRITLGYGVIIAAREVWVLAAGAGKEAAFRESLAPTGRTPLARVLQRRDRTKIFTDIRT
jgi:6-phosphogluconolactonase